MALDAPIAIMDKRRPRPNCAEILNIIGEVKGKNCIIIDDMIDTAGTLSVSVKALREAGAKSIYACATHGILSGSAMERLAESQLDELVITNSIALSPEKKQYSFVHQLSIAELLARGILNIIDDKPVSDLFQYVRDDKH